MSWPPISNGVAERKVIFSSEIFGGFEVMVPLDMFTNMRDIEFYCKDRLLRALEMNKFTTLYDKAKYINFHIHDVKFIDFIAGGAEIYICDVCFGGIQKIIGEFE